MFLNLVKKYIEKFQLFQKGERVLIGVSGGVDSVSLLEVLYLLKDEYNLKLFVSHYDHKIRKNSHEDAIFVYQLCKKKKLPFFYSASHVPSYAKKEKISLEMAGRELRYNLWYRLAKKYNFQKIALAHHLDDLVEEIFIRLIKGTGRRGLIGIPLKRENIIVRPFLFVTKKEIEKFALERKLNWREDITNKSPKFLRNKIRLFLIPFLQKNFSSKIKENIKKTAFILAQEEEFIEELAHKNFEEIRFFSESGLSLKISELNKIHPALRRRIYFVAFRYAGIPLFRITYSHLENLDNLVIKKTKGPLYLPGNFLVYRGQDHIVITKKAFSFPYFEITISKEGEYTLPDNKLLKVKILLKDKVNTHSNSMLFSAEKLKFPFIIRSKKPGDKIYIPSVGHKKLKKFLWEKRIPPYLRESVLIIEHNKEIVGIWGLYIHPDYQIKNFAKEILFLQLD